MTASIPLGVVLTNGSRRWILKGTPALASGLRTKVRDVEEESRAGSFPVAFPAIPRQGCRLRSVRLS